MVRVKIQLGLSNNADKVVWRYPEDSRYEHLLNFINEAFDSVSNDGSFQIQYKDDEGDLITCSSESDINDALNFAESEKLRSLKLFVVTAAADDEDEDEDEDEEDQHSLKQLNVSSDAINNSEPNEEDNDDDDDDDEQEEEQEEEEEEQHADEDDEKQPHRQQESGNVRDEHDDDNDDDDEEEEEVEDEVEDEEEEEEEEEEQPQQPQAILSENAEEEHDRDREQQEAYSENDDDAVGDEEPEEQDEKEEDEQPLQSQKETIPTLKELLELWYSDMRSKQAVATDFVVTICQRWPVSAQYPIHLGAMLLLVIEDKSKSQHYSFITSHQHYSILKSELKQFGGTDLQQHIKQMANLCNTVGVDKFSLLCVNILDAFKDVLEGRPFNLDFAPLLQATTPKHQKTSSKVSLQQSHNDETSSVSSFSAKLDAKPKKKNKKNKQKVPKKKAASPAIPKTKGKPKAKELSKSPPTKGKRSSPKLKSKASKTKSSKPRRKLHSHGAYVSCHECDACPIRGARFVCMVRPNYNICEQCESKLLDEDKLQYPMIKIYQPRPNWHIKNFQGLQELVAIPEPDYNAPSQVSQTGRSERDRVDDDRHPDEHDDDDDEEEASKSDVMRRRQARRRETPQEQDVSTENINDPSSMLKNFPFMSREMQEKYIDAMKQFNEPSANEAMLSKTKESSTLLLPTDSVSQIHTRSQEPAMPEIPIASIMPTIPSHPSSVTQSSKPKESATKENQSFMAEIDALLDPKNVTLHNSNSGKATFSSSRNVNAAGSGLEQMAFGANVNDNANMNVNASQNIGSADLAGLIDLVSGGPSRGGQMKPVSDRRNDNAANMNQLSNPDQNEVLNATVESTEHPGDILINASATMAWNIKNIGYRAFGENCKLAFVSGDGLLVSQYHIPDAKPNETVKVSMSFNAFSTPGTYETNFRLCHSGKQFGPQLVVKINVLDPNQPMSQPSSHAMYPQSPPQPMQPPQPQHAPPPQQQAQPYPPPHQQAQSQPQPQPQAPPQQQQQSQQQQPPSYWGQPPTHPPQGPYYQAAPPQQQQSQARPAYPSYAPQPQPQSHPQAQTQQAYQSQSPAQSQAQQPAVQQMQQPYQREPSPEPIQPRRPSPEPIRDSPKYEPPRSGPSFHEPTSLFKPGDNIDEKAKKEEKKGWFGWGKKKEAVKKESNLSCLCGATLIYLDVKQAYKGKKVYCDICSKVCKDSIFHCPSGDIRSHPGGFDLCYACGGSQLAKQPNPSPKEMLFTTDSGHDLLADPAVASNMAYPALKPSAPPAPSPNRHKKASSSSASNQDNYDPNFVYPSQLKQLLDMGFDRDKVRRLLLKHRGNTSEVLAQLIK